MFLSLNTLNSIEEIMSMNLTPEQEEIISDTITKLQQSAFRFGFMEGINRIAHEKDNERVVGTTETPLSWWLNNVDKETEQYIDYKGNALRY